MHGSQETLCLGFKKEKDYQIRRHGSQEPLCLGFKKEQTIKLEGMATKKHYVWVSRRKRLRLNKEAWQPRTTMFGFQEGKDYIR